MENRTLEDLRQGLLDGKLRIRHNGIDIFIDCMETKDMLVIPMTSAEGARREPRMERMTQDPDDGQGLPADRVRGVRRGEGLLREAGDVQFPVRRVRI